jgi:hypothetical protein
MFIHNLNILLFFIITFLGIYYLLKKIINTQCAKALSVFYRIVAKNSIEHLQSKNNKIQLNTDSINTLKSNKTNQNKFSQVLLLETNEEFMIDLKKAFDNNLPILIFNRVEQFNILNYLLGEFENKDNGWKIQEIEKSKMQEIFKVLKYEKGKITIKTIKFRLGIKKGSFDTSNESSIRQLIICRKFIKVV